MKSKIISIFHAGKLQPSGGSSGYLYNLQASLNVNNIDDVNIILVDKRKKYFFRELKILVSKNKYKQKKIETYRQAINKNLATLQNSNIIHFHTVPDLYYFSQAYNLKKHIVLLSHHAPELSEDYSYRLCVDRVGKENANKIKRQQRKMDILAFEKADYLIYPCEGAVSPYIDFFHSNNIDYAKKLRYIITSSQPFTPKLSKDQYRDKFAIPKDKKVIAYVGRKETIKGFDIFVEIAKRFNNDTDLFFVTAGVGGIEPPVQSNFLDIGWTDDPDSLVNAADILLIPNKNTYFDLIIIQALSVNTTIVTTKTGGNTWFEDKEVNLFFADYNNIDTFVEILNNSDTYIDNNKNIDLYNKYLHNDFFAPNYKALYDSILIKSKKT